VRKGPAHLCGAAQKTAPAWSRQTYPEQAGTRKRSERIRRWRQVRARWHGHRRAAPGAGAAAPWKPRRWWSGAGPPSPRCAPTWPPPWRPCRSGRRPGRRATLRSRCVQELLRSGPWTLGAAPPERTGPGHRGRAPPLCPHGHGRIQRPEQPGVPGPVQCCRGDFRCRTCGHAAAVADEVLGIGPGRLSPGLSRIAAMHAFGHPARTIHDTLSAQLGKDAAYRKAKALRAVADAESATATGASAPDPTRPLGASTWRSGTDGATTPWGKSARAGAHALVLLCWPLGSERRADRRAANETAAARKARGGAGAVGRRAGRHPVQGACRCRRYGRRQARRASQLPSSTRSQRA